jgi:two-component system, LytTR family, sensor kinase
LANSPFSQKKFRWAFFAWWVTWTGVQVWVLTWLGFSLTASVADGVGTNLLLAAACLLASNTLRYYLPQGERYWYILVLSLGLSGLWLLAVKFGMPEINGKEPGYTLFLTRSLSVRFAIGVLLIACMAMVSVLWYTFEDQKASDLRKADAEKLTREAELFKLRQQLQPHFLFNSLNSINALIGSRPQEARNMVQQLSEFLRGTLRREEQQSIPLKDELQYLQLYLDIEKVRFGNRLSTEFETPEETLTMMIPAMLLQPLVENAIKFGLYDTTGDTTIKIQCRQEGRLLVICVTNPFDPETAPPRAGTGFGLSSIQRRLYLLFARNDLLETFVVGKLFTTEIRIPQAPESKIPESPLETKQNMER